MNETTTKTSPQINFGESFETLDNLRRTAIGTLDKNSSVYSDRSSDKEDRDIKAVSSTDFACFDDYLAQIGTYTQLDAAINYLSDGLRNHGQAIVLGRELDIRVNPRIAKSLSDLIETSVAQINGILEHVPQTHGIEYVVPLDNAADSIARCYSATNYKSLYSAIRALQENITIFVNKDYGNAELFSEGMRTLRNMLPDQKFCYSVSRNSGKLSVEIKSMESLTESQNRWYQRAFSVVARCFGKGNAKKSE